MERLMRVVLAAMMIALLAIPAHGRGKRDAGAKPPSSAEQQKKSREEEKAYDAALRRIPNQKPADPWNKMR
jgi:hypothetical protein